MRRTFFFLICFFLALQTGLYAKPNECSEMEPVFSTGDWSKGKYSDCFSCLGKLSYSDGSEFFYTVTSEKDSEDVERYNFAVIFGSSDKCKKIADIFRLLDKACVLLKIQTGKVFPDHFVRAAIKMRDGEYFVEGKHVSISTKSHVTDISISIWK